MNFAETIANLRSELKTKNEALTAAQGQVTALTEQNQQLTTTTQEQATQITDLSGQVTTLTTENTTLKGQLEAATKNVQGQVIDQIAAAGVPPVSRAATADNTPSGAGKAAEGLTGIARVTAAFESAGRK